ncbi:unnamed protein product [Angiostrongylus costaricensis]|uniref:GH26 domain-containing protein n=1 Tax=Angiostrongylus costaricensis TaxID=334426 RepID=A0A0R3PQ43_ANGCS|nr:unnamed protein product [Angiostrongylus costaricensis]
MPHAFDFNKHQYLVGFYPFHLHTLFSAGLGTEVYMTPQPNSAKTAQEQVDEMYNYLTTSGIKLLTVWIQVTSPINWFTSITANVNFIDSIVTRAQHYGLNVGIYTNYYDWNQITSGLILDDTMLWYWNVYGPGVTGESPSDFSDFHSFAGWYTPIVKQFGQVESVCAVTVNRDVYATSSLMAPVGTAEFAQTKQIVVGILGLKNTTSMSKTKIKP